MIARRQPAMAFAQDADRNATEPEISVGFDYLTEKNDIMLFRRPKRFGVQIKNAEVVS